MHSLLMQGLVSADPLEIGLRVDANGALLDAQGRAATNLFYVGPLLRAEHWEATAAQELRGHAERLVNHLLSTAPRNKTAARPGSRLRSSMTASA
jgi:uncharacterized NAD(P)/FAD-binding protein YdhS